MEGLLILEVDLMLPLGALVVAGLDLKFHGFQRQADLPAGGLTVVQRTQIEVAGLVVGLGGGFALVIGLEQEEFRLGAYIEGVKAHILGFLQGPLEHVAGIAGKGRAVGVVYIADEPGHLAVVGLPGKHPIGFQVGEQVLVGLVDADEAFNGGTVKHALIVDRLLDLGGGDGHVFQLAENISELQTDEFDILFPYHADDVFFGVRHDRGPFLSFKIIDFG